MSLMPSSSRCVTVGSLVERKCFLRVGAGARMGGPVAARPHAAAFLCVVGRGELGAGGSVGVGVLMLAVCVDGGLR